MHPVRPTAGGLFQVIGGGGSLSAAVLRLGGDRTGSAA